MSETLARYGEARVSPGEWEVMTAQAAMLVKTGFLPSAIKTAEQAVAIMLTGRELDIPAMAALRSIDVIQGKPTVSPQLMLALVNRSGQLEEFSLSFDGETVALAAYCTMKRQGRPAHTCRFSITDAKSLGLASKANWQQQPRVMLQWRAVAACCRVVFPDVILGLYTSEEMGASITYDDSGSVAEVAGSEGTTDEATLARTAQGIASTVKQAAVAAAPNETLATPETLASISRVAGQLRARGMSKQDWQSYLDACGCKSPTELPEPDAEELLEALRAHLEGLGPDPDSTEPDPFAEEDQTANPQRLEPPVATKFQQVALGKAAAALKPRGFSKPDWQALLTAHGADTVDDLTYLGAEMMLVELQGWKPPTPAEPEHADAGNREPVRVLINRKAEELYGPDTWRELLRQFIAEAGFAAVGGRLKDAECEVLYKLLLVHEARLKRFAWDSEGEATFCQWLGEEHGILSGEPDYLAPYMALRPLSAEALGSVMLSLQRMPEMPVSAEAVSSGPDPFAEEDQTENLRRFEPDRQ